VADEALSAERLLERFGSLGAILDADTPALAASGAGTDAALRIDAAAACLRHVLGERLEDRPILGSMRNLVDYLTLTLSFKGLEQVRVLFLDSRLHLIRDETVSRGCVAEAPIFVRPILKRVLELDASAIVLAHNHPSGDPSPSEADIGATRALENGAAAIGVQLVDHLVLARGEWMSFRAEGLL
jgi:DNA repair protein RadC